jgi:hypothetical protein
MTRQQTSRHKDNTHTSAHQHADPAHPDRLRALASVPDAIPAWSPGAPPDTGAERSLEPARKTAARTTHRLAATATSRHDLLREASLICQAAAVSGECRLDDRRIQ